jgi:PEGA domain
MRVGSIAGLASAILLAGASVVAAQKPMPPPRIAPKPPAPAALSVPDPLAGTRLGPRDLYQSPDGSDRFQHLSPYPAPPVVGMPGIYFPGPYFAYPYGYPSYEVSIADTYKLVMADTYLRRYREEMRGSGGLVLETAPAAAQVFVDGNYVGLAEEFRPNGRAIELTAGAHHVELRAAGYETLTFNVMIGANNIVRYRGDMQVQAAKPAAAAVSTTPPIAKNFYVIPNCYAGDKPPTGALPKGCNRKNLQTRK